MKQRFTLLLLCLPLFVFSQNGIIGTGFANGWMNPGEVVGFDAGVMGSRIKILNPNGTGNQYFRMVKFWNNNNMEFGPFGCTDTDWTGGVNTTYENMPGCGSGAFYINCPNMTDNYVFKTPDGDADDFIYFRVQGAIRTITSVSSPAGGTVNENDSYEVRATLDDPLNSGQKVYLRFSTDNWSSSTVMEMAEDVGAAVPTDYLATIPGQTAGTTVNYYVLTSGEVTGTLDHNNADWFTINLNNNGGANYEYDVMAPLAVTFLNFEAQPERNQIRLDWLTENETNNSHFEIESSTDSRTWETIGTVDGAGDSFEKLEYSFVDKHPAQGLNYYRLKQVDFDGTYSYSAIVSVEFRPEKTVTVFPNPFAENLTIQGAENGSTVQVYDLNGRLLSSEILREENTELRLNGLLQGVYLLRIVDQSGYIIDSQRIVKL